jgi:uncharacterized protein
MNQSRKPWRWISLLLALGLLASGCAVLDQQQRKWIFQPGTRTWGSGITPDGVQDVWIGFRSQEAEEAVRIHGLWLPQPDAKAPMLLYLHGAGWEVRSSLPRLQRMHELGFAVLAIDYRGFGQSTDRLPSETLVQEDAQAAWAWMREQRPEAPRYVFGHSLGGAIAVQLAADVKDEAGLIVEGSFPSVLSVWRTWAWGWVPLGPLITQRFDAGSRIADVGTPVLVVHGAADNLVRPDLGRALYEKAAQPKRFVLVEGASHFNANSIGQPLYREALRDLFGLQAERREGKAAAAATGS